MDSLQYLIGKSSSNSNKNLDKLSKFFSQEELNKLSQKSVSIVGTNGKTTTAAVLNNILSNRGLSTLLFTSPHLVSLNERIQVNKEMIKDVELDVAMQGIKLFEKENNIVLGYFESIFLIAAKKFLDEGLDIFIAEAGIGGRLDTTSILNSRTVCLTNIGLDHTELLGTTIKEILLEKIHVSKKVNNFINGSEVIHNEYKFLIKNSLQVGEEQYFLGFQKQELMNSLNKNYIKSNQETAKKTAEVILKYLQPKHFLKNDNSLLNNIHNTIPDGRFQIIQESPILKILDGAHNPAGVEAFFNLLEDRYKIDEIMNFDCYIGFNKSKDFAEMLSIIWLKDYLYIKVLEDDSFFKQHNTEALKQLFISNNKEFQKSTLKEFHFSKKPSILLGSLYLVGEYIKEYK
jgi:dihydrofolate synthase/folylpolyglutamate synthase